MVLGGLSLFMVYRSVGFYVNDKENLEKQSEAEQEMSIIGKTCLKNAYERHLESQREDALFQDDLAKYMMGGIGAAYSRRFGEAAKLLGFPGWPEFGQQFTAVSTVMIDDFLKSGCEALREEPVIQIVNLGAGMDSRGYRLDFLSSSMVMYEVDFATVNHAKKIFLASANPEAKCKIVPVNCDLLVTGALETTLLEKGFDPLQPTLWIAEGLFSYIKPVSKTEELLQSMINLSGNGSEACFHFKRDDTSKQPGSLSGEKVGKLFEDWHDVKYINFGDPELDYGRYTQAKPNPLFAYGIAKKNNFVIEEFEP